MSYAPGLLGGFLLLAAAPPPQLRKPARRELLSRPSRRPWSLTASDALTYNPVVSDRRFGLVPHLLTFVRLPLGVAFLAVLDPTNLSRVAAAVAILVAAAVSDALDGHVARRMGTVSVFGKWADPLTDALFFLFVYLAFHRAGFMPALFVALFVGREVAQYAIIRPLTARRISATCRACPPRGRAGGSRPTPGARPRR